MSFLSHNKASIAIIISIVALLWNVYRDFLLRPHCRVRFKFVELNSRPRWSFNLKKAWVPYLELTVVNFGPGLLVVTAAVMKTPAAVESLEAENLGTELEKGQRVSIVIPNSSECCLDKDSRRIGIRDTFGRIHWAPTKDLKRVKRDYIAGKQKPAGTASS
jgi:hypothetical protein